MPTRMLFLFFFFFGSTVSSTVPIAVLHGIASSAKQMVPFCDWLELAFKRPVYNLEIGNGEKTSLYTPMREQLTMVCAQIYAMEDLRNGFDFIGMSQGGLLARGYVEQCNGFPVRNLITLVSPHGGVYLPLEGFHPYGPFIQAHVSFSNYWRDPTALADYQHTYLANLNNENLTENSTKNKAQMESLANFVLVWSPNDDILAPPESGKFSTFDATLRVIPVQDTVIYAALGLKQLDQLARFHTFETNCSHKEHRDLICYRQLYTIFYPFLS